MERNMIKTHLWVFAVVALVVSVFNRVLLRVFGFESLGAWAMILLISVGYLVVAFILLSPLLKERKSGKRSKKKVDSVAVSVWYLPAIIFYLGGSIFAFFGIFFMGILVLAVIKGNISNSGVLAVGGVGVFLIVLGVGIFLLGQYFSRKSKL